VTHILRFIGNAIGFAVWATVFVAGIGAVFYVTLEGTACLMAWVLA